MEAPSFFSYSFGCRLNQAEKMSFDAAMLSRGFVVNEKSPDYIVLNTCAVTVKAEREARQFLSLARKKWPKSKVIVTGCAATEWLKSGKKIANADLLWPNKEKGVLSELLLVEKSAVLIESTDKVKNFNQDKYARSGRRFIKIQDGCDVYCSFCIVPRLRGKPLSRKITEIVREIKLFETSVEEVILTGVNTALFGKDTGENLIDLLQAILDKTRVSRVSFGSLHPKSISEDFISFYKKNIPTGRLVNFFHVPLQSGSDHTISKMRRGYTTSDIKEKLTALAEIGRSPLISTDIIVGFPGESDSAFRETVELLKHSPVTKVHCFRYSGRTKTLASSFENTVSEKEKRERAFVITELTKRKNKEYLEGLIGTRSLALFLVNKSGPFREGILENGMVILVDDIGEELIGKIRPVLIENLKNGVLVGSLAYS